MKWLVIGGDKETLKIVRLCVRSRWPEATVLTAAEGSTGVDLLQTECPDLIIADLSSRDMNIVDLLSEIREFHHAPLMVMVQGQDEMANASVLELGADECIAKPLSAVELLAKAGALLRRAQGADGFRQDLTPFVSGQLSVNFATYEVFVSGRPVKLTPTEYKLLYELTKNNGRVVTNRALLERVWGPEYDTDSLKKYIQHLRSKCERDPNHPHIILSERGIGYKLVKPI